MDIWCSQGRSRIDQNGNEIPVVVDQETGEKCLLYHMVMTDQLQLATGHPSKSILHNVSFVAKTG